MKRLVDEEDLYQNVGDAMIRFMRIKPEPFLSNALRSQSHFWGVPPWKRALSFVFMLRFVMGYKAQRQWRKFTENDYKLNKRAFNRWVEKENDIFLKSPEFDKLPEFYEEEVRIRHKRKVTSTSELSVDSPVKRSFVVADESTSDDE